MNAPAFHEPAGLAQQEGTSLDALDGFGALAESLRKLLDGGGLDYRGMAAEYRALGDAAHALAGELHRASACYALASAINDETEAAQ